MASKSQKREKNTATRGHIATRGRAWPRVAPQPRVALRGHLRPRVAELGHVWLHEFDPRNKRRSHTWAIQTWSWSAASWLFLQPLVANCGTWFSTRSFLSSFILFATRGRHRDISPSATRVTYSHTRGATKEGTATRGHTGHAWRGSCQVRQLGTTNETASEKSEPRVVA